MTSRSSSLTWGCVRPACRLSASITIRAMIPATADGRRHGSRLRIDARVGWLPDMIGWLFLSFAAGAVVGAVGVIVIAVMQDGVA